MTSTLDHPQEFTKNNGDHGGGRNEFEGDLYVVSPPSFRRKGPQPMHINPPYINHQQRPYHKRSQEISRDRGRLMELIQNIPEDCFELSLKDIVEKQYVQGNEKESIVVAEEEGKTEDHVNHSVIKATKTNSQKNNTLRRGSMSRENVALKMFILSPLQIKTSSKPQSAPKVSPIYHLVQGGFDRGWWKKKFSTDDENKTRNSEPMIKSSSCNRSRRFAVSAYGCWSYFGTKD